MKMSMSFDVLDTQRFIISGPVISVSACIGSVSNVTPMRPWTAADAAFAVVGTKPARVGLLAA